MSKEVVRIVGGILSSDRMFSVHDGQVWFPLTGDVSEILDHVIQALKLHGYNASGGTRAYTGIAIEVEEAESISTREFRAIISDVYGYNGRVAGLSSQGTVNEIDPIEPGNILEIPAVGWVKEDCRVVIGHYDGTYLAKVHTPKLEEYKGTTLEVVQGPEQGEKATLGDLIRDKKVIVKKREWSEYPQQTYR